MVYACPHSSWCSTFQTTVRVPANTECCAWTSTARHGATTGASARVCTSCQATASVLIVPTGGGGTHRSLRNVNVVEVRRIKGRDAYGICSPIIPGASNLLEHVTYGLRGRDREHHPARFPQRCAHNARHVHVLGEAAASASTCEKVITTEMA